MEPENNNLINSFFEQVENGQVEITKVNQDKEKLMLNLQNEVKHDLLKFTKSLIRKAEAKNQLKDRVTEILMNRLTDEDQLENIGTQTLFRALEILNKGDNEFVGSILASLKSSSSLSLNLDLSGDGKVDKMKEVNSLPPQKDISNEDFKAVRNVLMFLNKAKESGEFPELTDEI